MLVPIRPTPITPSSMGRSFLLQDRHAGPASDVGQLTEILVVLVVAALPRAERLVILDELDRPDPLNHLEAELVLVPRPNAARAARCQTRSGGMAFQILTQREGTVMLLVPRGVDEGDRSFSNPPPQFGDGAGVLFQLGPVAPLELIGQMPQDPDQFTSRTP